MTCCKMRKSVFLTRCRCIEHLCDCACINIHLQGQEWFLLICLGLCVANTPFYLERCWCLLKCNVMNCNSIHHADNLACRLLSELFAAKVFTSTLLVIACHGVRPTCSRLQWHTHRSCSKFTRCRHQRSPQKSQTQPQCNQIWVRARTSRQTAFCCQRDHDRNNEINNWW
jgi:hypothetical protein